jgi:hypothetical protein
MIADSKRLVLDHEHFAVRAGGHTILPLPFVVRSLLQNGHLKTLRVAKRPPGLFESLKSGV